METFRKVNTDQQKSSVELSHSFPPVSRVYTAQAHAKPVYPEPELGCGCVTLSQWVLDEELRKRTFISQKPTFSPADRCNYCHSAQSESTRAFSHNFGGKNAKEGGFNDGSSANGNYALLSRKLNWANSTYSIAHNTNIVSTLKRHKPSNLLIASTPAFIYGSRTSDLQAQIAPLAGAREDCGASKLNNIDKYELQSYHILSHGRMAAVDNSKVFVPALTVLRSLFRNSLCLDDITNLSAESFIVFAVICEKKFKVKIASQGDTTGISQLVNLIRANAVDKRPEECKKIVLSYTIKQLKHRLREKYAMLYRKNSFEEFFYQFYFENISKAENIPLEDFYYPIASMKCKKNSAKTINKAYLANIRKSEHFMAHLRKYINEDFLSDYGKEIENKLIDLVNRWGSEFKKTDCVSSLKGSIDGYFKDSKSKLPWTLYEIQYAIGKVRKILL